MDEQGIGESVAQRWNLPSAVCRWGTSTFEVEGRGDKLEVQFEEPKSSIRDQPIRYCAGVWISALCTSFKLDWSIRPKSSSGKTGETLQQLMGRI
jgi:CyaY protein